MSYYEWQQIYRVMQERRDGDPELFEMMRDVQTRYDNDLVIPLPDVEGNPQIPVAAPALVAEAVDTLGMRAASTTPVIWTPPVTGTRASRERAVTRRKAWSGRWYENGLHDSLMGRAFRQWFAYGVPTLGVYPRFPDKGYSESDRYRSGKRGPGTRIEVMNPLNTYPEPRSSDEHRPPENIGMVYGRSRSWLMKAYGHMPGLTALLKKWDHHTGGSEVLWDVVEWFDCDWRVMGIMGPRHSYHTRATYDFYRSAGANYTGLELSRVPNRAEMVPFIAPRRITLDKIEGQVAKMLGTQDLLGRMYALHYKAAERGVFPDMVALSSTPDREPELVAGRWVDGREGEVNLVTNASRVDVLQPNESVSSYMTTDRLERSARITGGSSSLAHGESSGASIRTGRGFEAMAGYAIDPWVAEAQRVMGRNLATLNEAIAKTELGYFKKKKMWVFSGALGEREMTKYTPGDIYETCDNAVIYQFPGADVSNVTVAVAQLVGAGLMSKRTARAKHPFVDHPEDEERIDIEERLTDATVAGLQQLASTGEIPPADLASISRKVLEDGKQLFTAIEETQREAQERQATAAPEPDEAAGQVVAPETQPGLANPGMGAEMAPPDAATQRIQDTSDSDTARLSRLLFNLRNANNPAA